MDLVGLKPYLNQGGPERFTYTWKIFEKIKVLKSRENAIYAKKNFSTKTAKNGFLVNQTFLAQLHFLPNP